MMEQDEDRQTQFVLRPIATQKIQRVENGLEVGEIAEAKRSDRSENNRCVEITKNYRIFIE